MKGQLTSSGGKLFWAGYAMTRLPWPFSFRGGGHDGRLQRDASCSVAVEVTSTPRCCCAGWRQKRRSTPGQEEARSRRPGLARPAQAYAFPLHMSTLQIAALLLSSNVMARLGAGLRRQHGREWQTVVLVIQSLRRTRHEAYFAGARVGSDTYLPMRRCSTDPHPRSRTTRSCRRR